jgi:sialate O-acetylesterase
LLPKVINRCLVVPAIDLSLDDAIHISGKDQQRLGRRIAEAMCHLTCGAQAAPSPIALGKISTRRNPIGESVDVIIEFSNVVEALQAAGRPNGFSIVGEQGTEFIFRTDLEGSRVILNTSLSATDLEGKTLWYGYGMTSYCNIIDAAGRSLPVFGPYSFTCTRALSDYIRTLHVSPLIPMAWEQLPDTPDLGSYSLTPRTFTEPSFCNMHAEMSASSNFQVVWFTSTFTCVEPMKLNVLLGYDGPVKVWIDGKEIFHDPHGCNPAVADGQVLPMTAEAGRHDIMLALGSNFGQAWGIYLRFERRDVPKRLIAKGPGAYAMPELVE